MFAEFSQQQIGSPDLTLYCEDIYGRASGHLGLISLLGKIFSDWIKSIGLKQISIGGWVAYMTGNKVYGEIIQSSCVRCILSRLGHRRNEDFLARNIIRMLLCADCIANPSRQSDEHMRAVNYLETEGIIVCQHDETLRFSAPLISFSFVFCVFL
jgi:hypothetical protein